MLGTNEEESGWGFLAGETVLASRMGMVSDCGADGAAMVLFDGVLDMA